MIGFRISGSPLRTPCSRIPFALADSRLGSIEARASDQSRELQKMRTYQDVQQGVIKELHDDVTHMRKTTDEIRELLLRLRPDQPTSSVPAML